MKYVKTEDGHILKVGETTDYGFAVEPDLKFACRFVDLENEVKREFVRIVDQADAIEDLCDWIVFRKDGRINAMFQKHTGIPNVDCDSMFLGLDTDNGLIYVAKLNDKREWELL